MYLYLSTWINLQRVKRKMSSTRDESWGCLSLQEVHIQEELILTWEFTTGVAWGVGKHFQESEVGFHEVGERDSCTCMHVALLFWILSLFGNDLSLSTWPSAAEAWDGDLEPLLLVPPRTKRVSHNCPSHFPVVTCFSLILWLQKQPSPALPPVQWTPSDSVSLHNRLPGF